VDVWLGDVRFAARPDGSDDGAFGHVRPLRDGVGAEPDEGDGVTVLSLNRDGPATVRDRSRKGHDPDGRRPHGRARVRADVDASVLAGVVRVGAVERETAQNRPLDRPRPRERRRRKDDDGGNNGGNGRPAQARHRSSCCLFRQREPTLSAAPAVVKLGYSDER
jgi:hypothetical protein